MSDVHVNWSRMDYTARRVAMCPTCQKRRRMFAWGQDWYPTIWTCCACGDAWSEGGRMERPFKREWRSERSAWARRMWTESAARLTEGTDT